MARLGWRSTRLICCSTAVGTIFIGGVPFHKRRRGGDVRPPSTARVVRYRSQQAERRRRASTPVRADQRAILPCYPVPLPLRPARTPSSIVLPKSASILRQYSNTRDSTGSLTPFNT